MPGRPYKVRFAIEAKFWVTGWSVSCRVGIAHGAPRPIWPKNALNRLKPVPGS